LEEYEEEERENERREGIGAMPDVRPHHVITEVDDQCFHGIG